MRGIGNICEVLAIPSARFIKQGEEDGGIPWLFASASKSKKWTLCLSAASEIFVLLHDDRVE